MFFSEILKLCRLELSRRIIEKNTKYSFFLTGIFCSRPFRGISPSMEYDFFSLSFCMNL